MIKVSRTHLAEFIIDRNSPRVCFKSKAFRKKLELVVRYKFTDRCLKLLRVDKIRFDESGVDELE